jgi:hypothetical protein
VPPILSSNDCLMEEPKDFTCLMLVGFKIFSSRFVLLILSKSLRKAFLKCSFKALLHGKASIAILVSCNFFLSWSLSVYTLNQVACFMQNFFYKLFPPKWRNLTMKTLSYKLRRLSICSFDQISSLLFPPFQSCFIYHVLLFVDDVVTSWPQTKIFDWSDITCIVILAVQNRTRSIPTWVSCNF